ncbi:MAG: hypothetical protein ACQEUZ_18130 [Pseudomonadota bacterium]
MPERRTGYAGPKPDISRGRLSDVPDVQLKNQPSCVVEYERSFREKVSSRLRNANFSRHFDVIVRGDSGGLGLTQSLPRVVEGAPYKDDTDRSQASDPPCGPLHSKGRLSYTLLGCKIAPIWIVALFGLSVVSTWIGGWGLVALEKGKIASGMLRLLASALLFGVSLALWSGAISAKRIRFERKPCNKIKG